MASDVRRPGLPPGLPGVIEQGFDVPVTPTIGIEQAARLVREKIAAERLRCERLDVSELPVQRGALFDMSGARVPFPEGAAYDTCYVALIDPQVDAQWGHPAYWAFVPVDGGAAVVIQSTEFPENAVGAVRLYPVPLS
ncbi:MAG TPA: hypothetical protein VLS89_13385 [Candidatus Nanopelagicales bacterium]|nr:hypothetical protein [Candidatus Nanopelagicales bacterium]